MHKFDNAPETLGDSSANCAFRSSASASDCFPGVPLRFIPGYLIPLLCSWSLVAAERVVGLEPTPPTLGSAASRLAVHSR